MRWFCTRFEVSFLFDVGEVLWWVQKKRQFSSCPFCPDERWSLSAESSLQSLISSLDRRSRTKYPKDASLQRHSSRSTNSSSRNRICARNWSHCKLNATNLSRTVHNHKVMGYSARLEGSKYPRNGLLWNLCFVFPSGEDNAILLAYEPIVVKLAALVKSLEVRMQVWSQLESEFLLNSKANLFRIIQNVYFGLRSRGQCIIQIGTLFLSHLHRWSQYHLSQIVLLDQTASRSQRTLRSDIHQRSRRYRQSRMGPDIAKSDTSDQWRISREIHFSSFFSRFRDG